MKGIYIWLSHSCGIISNKQSNFGLNKVFLFFEKLVYLITKETAFLKTLNVLLNI